MNRIATNGSFGGSTAGFLGGAAFLAIAAFALYSRLSPTPPEPAKQAPAVAVKPVQGAIAKPAKEIKPNDPERIEAYQKGVEKGAAQAASWPKTPEALIEAFWKAASAKEYEQMTILSPGSSATDFKAYYDKWTPSPARKIGPAEADPRNKGAMLYPVKLDFPGFPDKTIKMAITTLPDGRIAIDGLHSIWW